MHSQSKDKQQSAMAVSEHRAELIAQTFAELDTEQTGRVPLSKYDPSQHPRVLTGTMPEARAVEVFEHFFGKPVTADIGFEEFLQYQTAVSNEVNKGRELDHDGHFQQLLRNCWGLNRRAADALAVTGIYPKTLEVPTGYLATRIMSLVWPDEARPGQLTGYKCVVKPVFARGDLPADKRGYFAFPEELERVAVTYLPVQAALLPPLSVAWCDAESGAWSGFRDVVSSNVDPSVLPPVQRELVLTQQAAAARAVAFQATRGAANPMYKKSSASFGEATESNAARVLSLKKAKFEGNNCGVAWVGRTGTFTSEFRGGPYTSSSLNVSKTTTRY
jgi:hypothetical protein